MDEQYGGDRPPVRTRMPLSAGVLNFFATIVLLLLGIACIVLLTSFITAVVYLVREPNDAAVVLLLLGGWSIIAALVVYGFILVARLAHRLSSFNAWRRRLIARGLCPNCRYSLTGLSERRCPECGENLDAMHPDNS